MGVVFTDLHDTCLQRNGHSVQLKKEEDFEGVIFYYVGLKCDQGVVEWSPISNQLFNIMRQELE